MVRGRAHGRVVRLRPPPRRFPAERRQGLGLSPGPAPGQRLPRAHRGRARPRHRAGRAGCRLGRRVVAAHRHERQQHGRCDCRARRLERADLARAPRPRDRRPGVRPAPFSCRKRSPSASRRRRLWAWATPRASSSCSTTVGSWVRSNLQAFADDLAAAANRHSVLMRVNSSSRANVPQLLLDIDRTRALGIPLNDNLRYAVDLPGSAWVNDFSLFGRTYRVMIQADTPSAVARTTSGRSKCATPTAT